MTNPQYIVHETVINPDLAYDHPLLVALREEQPARVNQKDALFLEAWKKAVRLAGENHFRILVDDVDAATDREQLRPIFHEIKDSLWFMSPGQKHFMIAIYQFFNGKAIRDVCDERDWQIPRLDEHFNLDPQRHAVICQLLNNYRGW